MDELQSTQTAKAVARTKVTMDAIRALSSSSVRDVAADTPASSGSLEPLTRGATSVAAAPRLAPPAASVGGGTERANASPATGSANSLFLSTSSLGVHNAGVVSSLAPSIMAAATPKSRKSTASGKRDKLAVAEAICSTSSTPLSSNAEQSPTATESDLAGMLC